MTDDFVEDFLAGFDDSRFPAAFLQQYELMECLSHNEIGETFLVKERQTGTQYVAKCYPNKAHPSRTTEGELLRKLNHPGLPAYIGEYQNEEMLCIVRSYAQGQSLAELVRDGPVGQQQSLFIGIQLCEILIYLHDQSPPLSTEMSNRTMSLSMSMGWSRSSILAFLVYSMRHCRKIRFVWEPGIMPHRNSTVLLKPILVPIFSLSGYFYFGC